MHFVIPNPVYSWYCRCCGSVSLSTHTSPYLYSSQLPLEVLTNVNVRVPVTANRVTCVTLGRDSELCGGGALPPGPLLVEIECSQKIECVVCGRCVYMFMVCLPHIMLTVLNCVLWG